MKGSLPDPLAAAHRVKDLARDFAGELADGYRKSTRHVRMRAAIVGSWALLSAVTLWVACPGSGASNPLGAEVQLLTGSIMGTQVLVKNDSDKLWTEVTLTLDGGWRYARKTVRAGDKLVLSLPQFHREDGSGAPAELRPASLTIECEEGRVTASLAGPAR